MWYLSLLPFLFQGLAILFDEFYFHVRRGLPRWERIGHPIDTFSQLLTLGILLFIPYGDWTLKLYGGAAIFSCILVTKDEFIHKEEAPWEENWLHAVLFVLHPIALLTAGIIFLSIQDPSILPKPLLAILNDKMALQLSLYGYFFSILTFFIYQVVFWNFIWKPKQPQA